MACGMSATPASGARRYRATMSLFSETEKTGRPAPAGFSSKVQRPNFEPSADAATRLRSGRTTLLRLSSSFGPLHYWDQPDPAAPPLGQRRLESELPDTPSGIRVRLSQL